MGGVLAPAACACPGEPLGSSKSGLPETDCEKDHIFNEHGQEQRQERVVLSAPAVTAAPPRLPAEGEVTPAAEVAAEQGGSYLNPSQLGRLIGDSACAICLEPLRSRAQTVALCGHVFHRGCLNRYGDILCPQCRQPIDELSGTRWGCFTVGALVTIHGLQNHVELNGTRCRVVEIHEATHRLEVRTTDGGRLYRVRPENLAVAGEASVAAGEGLPGNGHAASGGPAVGWDALEPGAPVRLEGLQTAHGYNGRRAVILSTDRAVGRCEIRLEDGSVKTIRVENLRALSEPAAPAEPATAASSGASAAAADPLAAGQRRSL